MVLAADARGVRAHPQARGGGEHHLDAQATGVADRVPAEGQAVQRVERGDAHAIDRALARGVAVGRVRVVPPALVTADVDRRVGGGHAERGVSTGVVDPRGLQGRAGGVDLPARRRVAQHPGVHAAHEGAGGADHEVGAVGGDVDVVGVGVEEGGAGRLEAVGLPVGDRVRGQVDHGGLVTILAVDQGEVADRHHLGAVGRDVELADAAGAAVVLARERHVDGGVEGAAHRVQRRELLAGDALDGRERPADVELAVGERHVVHGLAGADLRLELRHDLSVGRIQLHQALVPGLPVHGGETASDVDAGAIGPQGEDLAVERGHEVLVDRPGGGVERQDARDVEQVAADVLGLQELTADDHLVAHLDDRVDLPVLDVGRPVGRIGGDQRGLRGAEGARGDGRRGGQQTQSGDGHRQRDDQGGGTTHSGGSFARGIRGVPRIGNAGGRCLTPKG